MKKRKILLYRVSKGQKAQLLLLDVDPLQILEMNPCASSDPSQGTQKPDTSASHCAPHLVTYQPQIHQQLQLISKRQNNHHNVNIDLKDK